MLSWSAGNVRAKAQISVHFASRNIDLAAGMKRAVVVVVPSEEQAAGDADVGTENLSGIAPVEIEAGNLGRLQPNLLRNRAPDHHDHEWHVHIRKIERTYHSRAKQANTARMNMSDRPGIGREPFDQRGADVAILWPSGRVLRVITRIQRILAGARHGPFTAIQVAEVNVFEQRDFRVREFREPRRG